MTQFNFIKSNSKIDNIILNMAVKVYYNDNVSSTLENLKTASSQSSGIIIGKVILYLLLFSFT